MISVIAIFLLYFSISEAKDINTLNIDGVTFKTTMSQAERKIDKFEKGIGYLYVDDVKHKEYITGITISSKSQNPVYEEFEFTGNNTLIRYIKIRKYRHAKPDWKYIKENLLKKLGYPDIECRQNKKIRFHADMSMNDTSLCWGDCYEETMESDDSYIYSSGSSIPHCKKNGKCIRVFYTSYTKDDICEYEISYRIENFFADQNYKSFLREKENWIRNNESRKLDF